MKYIQIYYILNSQFCFFHVLSWRNCNCVFVIVFCFLFHLAALFYRILSGTDIHPLRGILPQQLVSLFWCYRNKNVSWRVVLEHSGLLYPLPPLYEFIWWWFSAWLQTQPGAFQRQTYWTNLCHNSFFGFYHG